MPRSQPTAGEMATLIAVATAAPFVFRGGPGPSTHLSVRGEPVLRSRAPLAVPDVEWTVVAEITTPYSGLARNHGVQVVRDLATSVDTQRKVVTLARGASIGYDKLIVSPGTGFSNSSNSCTSI